jgi:alpha-beta hydrolase superfamily lysophospholipase
LGYEILKAIDRVHAEASAIELPVLILHGEADRLTSPDGARRLHEAVSSPDKAFRIYDGLYHEVYNEPEHPRVLGDVLDWIDAHLPT